MSFTIQNVLVPVAQSYATVDVQVVNEQITTIAANQDVIGTAVDGQNKLLLPGFVNAHTHSSEMWQRGLIPPIPLELWLAQLYEFTPLEPEQVYLSALATAVETLLSGGTSVVDHLVLIPGKEIETIASAVRAYHEIGIRAFIAPLIQDESLSAGIPDGDTQKEHEAYIRSTQETLALMQEAVDKFHNPKVGMHILVGPTGVEFCSDALFEGCIELSDRYNLCRHSHLLETKAQQKLAQEKYGCSAVEHLQQIGYLSPRTSLAHCVWLNDADIAILAETRSTVVHNPLSNLRLGSGIAPILKYRQAGVNVSFGCDGPASNDSQDLLEAIKMGSILHNVTDLDYQHWITPRQAVEMASLGGAKGLDMGEQLGSLTVGKKADLVLYDLTSLSLLPRTDPIGLLILGRPTNAVDSVWVNGKQVVAEGKVTTTDVDALRQELFERSQWSTSRQSQAISQVEAHYRSVMGLSKSFNENLEAIGESETLRIEINIPEVVAEVTVAFERYEKALVSNDIAVLDELFWNSPHTLRYGVTENLYGYDAIATFRKNRSSVNLERSLMNTVITTYGRDFATANTEFQRQGTDSTGRQSQTWIRTEEGWRIVSAHVSLLKLLDI